MNHPIFVLDGTNQYQSIYSFCLELSRMGGVALDGHSYPVDMLVPYRFARPEFFTEIELEVWFEANVRGPDFSLNEMTNGNYRPADGWWNIDKKVQKAWRDNAIAELEDMVGYMFPKKEAKS
jgi:hypothetical protein